MTTEVSEDHAKSKVSEREHIRRTFYKNPIKKDNPKLDLDWNSSQEERRKCMLEHQKRCRDQNFNAARGILSYLSELKYEDQEDWENCQDEEEDCEEDEAYEDFEAYEDHECYEDCKEIKGYEDYKKSDRNLYENNTGIHRYRKMMLSEWMVVVPEDLVENWVMIPCPVGNRRRLISGLGKTRSYNKYGVLCDVFNSALPGGSLSRYPNSIHALQYAILDCIWVKTKQTYYVLDVLFWNSLPFTDCEMDLRLFWIKSKLAEIENLQDRDTDTNTYPILPLPSINCDSDLSAALENLDPKLFPLDGLLFYHRAALYTFMKTPLVTWLKPYMLPEKLGVSVSPPLDERPDDYINFEHFIERINNAKKFQNREIIFTDIEKENTEEMEIDRKMETEIIEIENEDEKVDQKIEIENEDEKEDQKIEIENEDEKEDQKIEIENESKKQKMEK
ncbi:snurportin-1 [Pseudomyrmex gracilis]|uniref:snurportin-1 n=1 Tax=Pseudomyrmex gracilis TaxID=219809 RepID=UPI00099575DE|nr:snurportin-1 [Pseudomyrmex gracilis]